MPALTRQLCALQVCKAFAQVFEEASQCCQVVCMPHDISPTQLASLRAWAEQHREVVQHARLVLANNVFQASPETLSLLYSLSGFRSQLRTLSTLPASELGTVQVLSGLTALTTCSIQILRCMTRDDEEPHLNLSPLSSLKHLQSLRLQGPGRCTYLEAAQHLTKLVVLDDCSATSAYTAQHCTFANTLQTLIVQRSDINLQHAGVSGFSELKYLHVLESTVEWGLSLTYEFSRIPAVASWQAMVHLGSLDMYIPKSYQGDGCVGSKTEYGNGEWFDLDWVTVLTGLRSLVLVVDFQCAVPAGISSLTQLTKLWLWFTSEWPSKVMVNWAQDCCLQDVQLGQGLSYFDERLLHLAELNTLSVVKLNLVAATESAQECRIKLREHFAKRAPNVSFSLS